MGIFFVWTPRNSTWCDLIDPSRNKSLKELGEENNLIFIKSMLKILKKIPEFPQFVVPECSSHSTFKSGVFLIYILENKRGFFCSFIENYFILHIKVFNATLWKIKGLFGPLLRIISSYTSGVFNVIFVKSKVDLLLYWELFILCIWCFNVIFVK